MIDRHSPTWVSITEWTTKELEGSIKALSNPKLSYEDTQFHRGRVHMLNQLTVLPERQQEARAQPDIFEV
jgi:hypothetical protein